MSHEIKYSDHPLNCDRKRVQIQWDNYAAMEDWQEGCSGVSPIRWLENVPIAESYSEAEKLISKYDKGWYDCLAVRYYKTEPIKPTQKLTNLRKAYNDASNHFVTISSKLFCEGFKSQFVGCKGCGSKLSTQHIKSNRCPLCGTDLRSETTLKQIENAKKKHNDLEKTLELEEKKLQEKEQKNKGEARWLVKVEYHT